MGPGSSQHQSRDQIISSLERPPVS
jgi:hypothetical protein